jgi:hypothetical protein
MTWQQRSCDFRRQIVSLGKWQKMKGGDKENTETGKKRLIGASPPLGSTRNRPFLEDESRQEKILL